MKKYGGITAVPKRRHTLSDELANEFAELYKQYFPRVFAFACSRVQNQELASDIASAVFEKAFLKRSSLRSKDAFGPWVFTIARREIASHWRRGKPATEAKRENDWNLALNLSQPDPEDTLLHQEQVATLRTLLRQLPPREQEIISLKFDAELTNRQIAQIVGTGEVNVRVTIFRALRKLRERMQLEVS